jgi:hypothetical protein
MKVIYKTTTELTDLEIEEICTIFSKTFSGHNKSISDFRNEFLNTEFGYSYHGLLIDGNKIVGSQAFIPFIYLIDNIKTLVALSVDTMVLKYYRNFDNIFDLLKKGHNHLISNNFSLLIGFPNENAFPLLIKGMREREIGKLDTYILPYKISKIKPNLSFFDYFSKTFSKLLINLSYFSFCKSKYNFRIKKDRKFFDKLRYKWFNEDYKFYNNSEVTSVYKIKKHKGVQTAFLIDVYPMNKKNFDSSVRYIYKNEINNFDIIIYVGRLHFTPLSMIKIPKKYQPKKFHFTAKIFDNVNLNADVIYNIDNWEVNLSNYDLV